MKITDAIGINVLKSNQDASLNTSVNKLLSNKIGAFNSSGIENLISGPSSIFQAIKQLIGKFQQNYTNSINIIEENSEQFFSKIEGFDELPEDLK